MHSQHGVCGWSRRCKQERVNFARNINVSVGALTVLQLDGSFSGLNDGTVNGVSYFKCPPACGVFAKPDMFELVEEGEDGNEDTTPRGQNG